MILSPKQVVRKKIAEVKKRFSDDELKFFSSEVISTLELTSLFQNAGCILAYYSMKDEVNTREFIHAYSEDKRFILPVVFGNELLLKEYRPEAEMSVSGYGIYEPKGDVLFDVNKIDLIIVPGVAFDRKLHRLGRGKGFYDRLLGGLKIPKIGICFDFQLLEDLPHDDHDVKMNMIISQNEIIME